MAAEVIHEPAGEDWLVVAVNPLDDHITGVEPSWDRAVAIGRELARAGSTVTIQAADPFAADDVECILRRRR